MNPQEFLHQMIQRRYYTKDGSGPRHFDFSPNNRFVYVSNEMDGMVYSYKIDNKTGF